MRVVFPLGRLSLMLLLCMGLAEPTTKPFPAVGDPKLLPNAHRVTDKVLSGAQPEGDAAFKQLAELGVKTIISVDGAKPDVAAAKKYGIRYVHLPIGYDGVPAERGKELAKAIEELPGLIYIHCHHGKHRSAAAVSVACVNLGALKPAQAEDVLKTFGTGVNYKGLWKDSTTAQPLTTDELAAVKVKYVEIAKLSDMAEHMVGVDEHFDHVKLTQKSGWKQPKDHPDLDPAHEVLQVEEHLHESGRLEAAHASPADFRKLLGQSEKYCQELRDILSDKPIDTEKANAAFAKLSASCVECHKAYRD